MSCFDSHLCYSSPANGGWGIIRVGALIPGSHLLFVCPSACFRHGALGAIQHGYKQKISYLYIEKTDIVQGYDQVIRDGIEELLQRLDHPISTLLVFVSCLDDFIGTDIDMIMKQSEQKYAGIRFRACHMNPIAADTKMPPLVTTFHSMLDILPTQELRADEVALLGNFVPLDENNEIHAVLQSLGIRRVHQLANCMTPEEYDAMGGAKYGLVLTGFASYASKKLASRTGMQLIPFPVSYQLPKIREGYARLAEALGGDCSFVVERAERRALEKVAKAREIIGDLPIVVSDSATLHPVWLADALLSFGFNVTTIYAQALSGPEEDLLEELQQHYPELKAISATDPSMADRVQERRYEAGGREAIERFRDNVLMGAHPSQMIKPGGLDGGVKPFIMLMPWIFARIKAQQKHMQLIWPEDGAPVLPITATYRDDADGKYLREVLTGSEIGTVFRGQGFFPAACAAVDNELPGKLQFLGWEKLRSNELSEIIALCREVLATCHVMGVEEGEVCDLSMRDACAVETDAICEAPKKHSSEAGEMCRVPNGEVKEACNQ